ncbi:MAG TPA: hypothetical protein ENN85_05125 [Methanoculleus sp.]|nr:hypothetical protein [Methanomicrobiaceae archaeon]HDR73272.1 hypothetical protein [Methanoculleus sp.]
MACEHCKSESARGTPTCPFCGEELYRTKRREQLLYYLLVAGIFAALLFFFLTMRNLPIF